MTFKVADIHCPYKECKNNLNPLEGFYNKKGYYKTKHNYQPVPRYQCKTCKKYFSSQTFKDTYKQKKPELNKEVFKYYSSAMTQRRLAKTLDCNLKTVVRKFLFLADKARKIHNKRVSLIKTNIIMIDEMETSEHTKMKPLSIAIIVDGSGKEIIDLCVAEMNCKGHLAKRSQEKYGYREDWREDAMDEVLNTAKKCANENVKVFTDGKTSYPSAILRAFPKATIEVSVSRGKRHDTEFDPLFGINHMAAVLRHDLSRLSRRTWVTTKKAERLQAHLDMYIAYRNEYKIV